MFYRSWERMIAQHNVKIKKMEKLVHEKDDVKTVVLGKSKMIVTWLLGSLLAVAWFKCHEVPIEKSLLAKFAWAMVAEPGFKF
ncbi:hypothetical protein ARALYDRAFT_920810 [Arabidopsis lyrata subsp. lyrata]|uniref:Topoisomerase I C-terminal domain-containing protein n=1 Tax=Arabidopsis lyrata subsp. lyrata TaxID=81972 RepID=D7MXU3_ARALL|nr:hypothetical protein ARALYDRAFT_920810 [Arabidopsis lyrata subsp. lyrata]